MMTRGGARPGSGRKKKEDARVTLAVRIKPDTKRQLQAIAAERGLSVGQLVDDLAAGSQRAYISAADLAPGQ